MQIRQYPELVTLPLESICSDSFGDDLSKWPWRPHPTHLATLVDAILAGASLPPILVVEEAGKFVIVNGHNRVYACREAGVSMIRAVILEGDFESTEDLRMADIRLKAYDRKTGYKYDFGAVLTEWTTNVAAGCTATRWQRARVLALVAERILAKVRRRIVYLAFR